MPGPLNRQSTYPAGDGADAAVALFLCEVASFFCALVVTGAVVEVNGRVWPKALKAFVAWRLRSIVMVEQSNNECVFDARRNWEMVNSIEPMSTGRGERWLVKRREGKRCVKNGWRPVSTSNEARLPPVAGPFTVTVDFDTSWARVIGATGAPPSQQRSRVQI